MRVCFVKKNVNNNLIIHLCCICSENVFFWGEDLRIQLLSNWHPNRYEGKLGRDQTLSSSWEEAMDNKILCS